eukprot:TRINITY_DN42787_c0_g1_i1.p2 TRINITY_DN42787_c0_g1~~TRINITY_DN42787_c0_g1_i1.p2  ORF type:complete len:351 (-),score=57.45 TRINITY_DN42787_c0_g1_i1:252-1304(-)
MAIGGSSGFGGSTPRTGTPRGGGGRAVAAAVAERRANADTCVVVDAAEVAASYIAAREDVRFPRLAQTEGVRRAIHGLQAQGLTVVIIAAEQGIGGDFVSHAKRDGNVDAARLEHIIISSADDGPAETLKLAQSRGFLFASRVNHRDVTKTAREIDLDMVERCKRPGALPLKELQDWAHEVRITRQIRYDFDHGGIFRCWLPQGIERGLGRQRGEGLSTAPFALGRNAVPSTGRGHTFAKDQSADFSRRLGLAHSFREARPLQVAADPLALTRMLEGHRQPPQGIMRILEATPRQEGGILCKQVLATPSTTKSSARSQRRPPLPVSEQRPATVERSGVAMSLDFSLGTTI